MTKNLITLTLLLSFFIAQSQTKDSVSTGAQNANDVFYSFENGIVKTEPNNNWDLAFETTGFTGSIMANHVKGMMVWQSPYALEDWTNFDTTNKNSWKALYNNTKGWSYGALNQHANSNNNPFDLGWGIYDPMNNHTITGDTAFLLKLANGGYKKIIIITLTSNIFTIKYANVDGSNETTKTIELINFKGKNFAYFSFDTESTVDREPANDSWDIVFTKYTVLIPTPYNVGGIWTNKGITTAEANTSVTTTDYSPFAFSTINSEIGYDWKTYNQPKNIYDITDNLVYFVKRANGQVFKIVMTGYKGGASGTYYFSKQSVTAGLNTFKDLKIKLYPNPAKDLVFISVPNNNTFIAYTLTDLSGKLIQSGSETMVETSNLSDGVYFMTIETELGAQHIKLHISAQ